MWDSFDVAVSENKQIGNPIDSDVFNDQKDKILCGGQNFSYLSPCAATVWMMTTKLSIFVHVYIFQVLIANFGFVLKYKWLNF